MATDEYHSQETRKHATGHQTGSYEGYIRRVVVDRKVCKIVTNMYVLSFINQRPHGVLDREQPELGTLKVEIIHTVEG